MYILYVPMIYYNFQLKQTLLEVKHQQLQFLFDTNDFDTNSFNTVLKSNHLYYCALFVN